MAGPTALNAHDVVSIPQMEAATLATTNSTTGRHHPQEVASITKTAVILPVKFSSPISFRVSRVLFLVLIIN